MKALQIIGYGDIAKNVEISEVDKPIAGDHQVLIEVHAASINPIDYKIIEGAMKNINELSFPAPIGFDLSGVVADKGEQVSGFEIGEEVFARVPTETPGTFAKFIAVDANVVVNKPKNLSHAEASSIPLVGLTSVQSFEEAGLKADQKVLIHAGSGGVGSFAVQYAKSKGAYVYTTTSTGNTDWVKKLGADRVIDYKKENYLEIAKEVDMVFDTLGGDYTKDAFKILKKGGSVITIAGDPDNDTAKDLGLNGFIRLLLKLKRFKIDQKAKSKDAYYKFVMMHPDRIQLEEIQQLLQAKAIRPIVDKTYPLSDAVEALEYVKKGHTQGKVVLSIK
jgi:NADPH:quinone reductase-like Zn-dependent oxidoreductase